MAATLGGMRRTWGALVLIAAAVGMLAGCTSPPPTDPAKIQEWLDKPDATEPPLGAFAGGLVDSHDTAAVADLASNIRLDSAEPMPLRGIDFACFGVEKASVSVMIETGSESGGVTRTASQVLTIDDIPCTGEAAPLDLPLPMNDVRAVSAGAQTADGEGAWKAWMR